MKLLLLLLIENRVTLVELLCILLIVLLASFCFVLYKYLRLRRSSSSSSDLHKILFQIFDNLPFPILVKDVNDSFKYLFCNKETTRQLGISPKEVIGKNDLSILGPERSKSHCDIDHELVEKGNNYFAEEPFLTTDGVTLDTMVVKTLVNMGETERWLLVGRWPIAQPKRYEREMEKAKNQLEEALRKQDLALRSINFGLVYLDIDFRVIWETTSMIRQMVEKHCYIPGEICYKTTLLGSEFCGNCHLRTAIQEKRMTQRLLNIDGLTFEITATPVYEHNSEKLIGGLLRIENVTEKIKKDEMLVEAKDRAEESNRLKTAFLANMSHEIRTPLSVIVGFSDLIMKLDDADEKEEFIKIINANNELLLQLIDDILDLSKIDAGIIDLQLEPTNVFEIMQAAYIQAIQKNQNPNIEIQFDEKLDSCIVVSDRRRLIQVINNLLSNAMKFTNHGSISLGYRMDEVRNEVCLYVKDTGIGIPSDQKERIFERFVKLNSYGQGTGIGLSICRVIADRLGSTIGVDSIEGEGSCFWFRIPIREA